MKHKLAKPLLEPKSYDLRETYDWSQTLKDESYKDKIIPVEKFVNAPLHNVFHHIRPGIKIEVPNFDHFKSAKAIGGVYWVATVKRMSGYRALLRYEGAVDDSQDFWIGLGSADIHPVGWCAGQGKPLVPPNFLRDQKEDWKGFLVKALTGSRTLPPDFSDKVKKSIRSQFEAGMRLEMVDNLESSRIRVMKIQSIIGHRLELSISNADAPKMGKSGKSEDEGEDRIVWVHSSSPLIFPVGFATRTGYQLWANAAYKKHCEHILSSDPDGVSGFGGAYDKHDAVPALFSPGPKSEFHPLKHSATAPTGAQDAADHIQDNLINARKELCQWQPGMKLEVLDIMTFNEFHVATVNRILEGDYLEISIDEDKAENPQMYPYHKLSPYLLPCGYCEAMELPLSTPTKETVDTFDWKSYLKQTQSKMVPELCFEVDKYDSSAFVIGGQLEAVDMSEAHFVCPATVVDHKGSRLLKIHFQGWGSDMDQYVDFRSPDIFPVGWAELVGYKLEKPATGETALPAKEEEDTPGWLPPHRKTYFGVFSPQRWADQYRALFSHQ